jgi:hypothetical protein
MDPGAELQRPQPQQRGFRENPPCSSELRGVGVVHRRPDGKSSLGASRSERQASRGAPVRAAGLFRAASRPNRSP